MSAPRVRCLQERWLTAHFRNLVCHTETIGRAGPCRSQKRGLSWNLVPYHGTLARLASLGGGPRMVRTDGFPSAGMVVTDSVTLLDGRAAGAVVVAGSHSGVYPARLVAVLGARAVAFNDAGVGKDRAGIAGLEYLDGLGLPAVAVGHETARIGDGHDSLERGVVRHANRVARALGCAPGLTCRPAVRLLAAAPPRRWAAPRPPEGRPRLLGGAPEVWALDSVSLAGADDTGRVLVT